ncbi:Uncharacterized protein GNX_2019 [Leptospira interrogans serovar Canicola]|nr:Uncharacterized protein GNX_2019 [Leptospira interrogans serovar Canicola]
MRKSFFVVLGIIFTSILLGFFVWKILTRKTDSVYRNFSKSNWEDVILEVLSKKESGPRRLFLCFYVSCGI